MFVYLYFNFSLSFSDFIIIILHFSSNSVIYFILYLLKHLYLYLLNIY